jgi:cytochrome c556
MTGSAIGSAPAQRFVFIALLVGLILATAALANETVANRGVQRRLAAMDKAGSAMVTLGGMMGGRILFDKGLAKAARKNLISATRSIPSVFRRPNSDPHSRARPEIWTQRKYFKASARAANRAARALNVNTLGRLRSTLPRVVATCLACHELYRDDRR